MTDDEGPDWKPRIINKETRIQEWTAPNGVKFIFELQFGEYDMVHFERMCRLHPMIRYTYDPPEPKMEPTDIRVDPDPLLTWVKSILSRIKAFLT